MIMRCQTRFHGEFCPQFQVRLSLVPLPPAFRNRLFKFRLSSIRRLVRNSLQRLQGIAFTSPSFRVPILSPSRLHKVSIGESSSIGAPFKDLRRRPATINGSTSSVSVASQDLRSALSPITNPSPTSLLPTSTPLISERSGSPTESTVSTANSVSFRPSSRLYVGSTDGQKPASAVGSSKMNAIGLLEAHSKMRHDGSPDESGSSSPMSMSTTS